MCWAYFLALALGLMRVRLVHAQDNKSLYRLADIQLTCPKGWELNGAQCYKVYNTPRSWPQALAVCGRYGSQMARVQTQDENQFVGKIAQALLRPLGYPYFWIGLANQQASPTATFYVWSDGQVVSKYAGFWQLGQPDIGEGSCVMVNSTDSTFGWTFSMCNYLLPFVCQMSACLKGSFFCLNGGCINEKLACNGYGDCSDFSDELNCPAASGNAACLRLDRGESNTLQSPNYPSSYWPNSNCRWILEGPINTRISLKFDFFETEQYFDIVDVLDGGPVENTSAVIATLSGTMDPKNLMLQSSTNMLTIKFRSDSQLQARGFQATWKAVSVSCGGKLTAQPFMQTFMSPDYPSNYPNGIECVWTIAAPRNSLITLDIRDLMLEPNKDYLLIYDGPNPSSPVLLRFSGVFEGSQLLISSQNQLYIYFFSNYAVAGRGFKINYKQGCDNKLTEAYGNVLSPGNLEVHYPPSQTCTYVIESPENDMRPLTLAVNKFDVMPDDVLEVYEGPSNKGLGLHTGKGFGGSNRPPSSFVSRRGSFYVVFKTNPMNWGMGFNLTYSINCPSLKIPDGISLSSNGTGFGSQVTVSCPRGFEFVTGDGPAFTVECLLGGKWSKTRIPPCQPRYCAPVPQIRNGFAYEANNVTYGGVAKYQCYQGFSFPSGRESEEIYCTEGGRWTQTPLCKAQTCPALPPFRDGDRTVVYGDGTGYGTVLRYECRPGFYRVGPPTILCETGGKWSNVQPSCKKVRCPDVPVVENAIVENPNAEYFFEDVTRVACKTGFRTEGSEVIVCHANQSFSQPPKCIDIDECAEGSAGCFPGSTWCKNLDGGYQCICLDGYNPQLSCTIANALPISTKPIESSTDGIPREWHSVSTEGWCGTETNAPMNWITINLPEPTVIERIRLEKVGQVDPAFVNQFSLRYSQQPGDPVQPFTTPNGSVVLFNGNAEPGPMADIILLPIALEVRVLMIVVEQYVRAPCMKLEVYGCRKTSCMDINECNDRNGGCDQLCLNTPGTYMCQCREGYDLFTEDNVGGKHVHASETGLKMNDLVRFNMSCIARTCPGLTAPDNGQLISTAKQFTYPDVVEFTCQFGYELQGATYLQCLTGGTWNGTVPTCTPASCQNLANVSQIGLIVQPGERTIAYGQNVSVTCSMPSRPNVRTPFSTFRQCVYDPQPDGKQYRLAGTEPQCPLVDCGPPIQLAGANYEGLNLADPTSFKVGNQFAFSCRQPYALGGNSSQGDHTVRCRNDGTWDFGNLRCEGPVCVDPGYPPGGIVELDSVEEGSVARYSCGRAGYKPYPGDAIKCILGAPCLLSEDLGISTGLIPDTAFADNGNQPIPGYEPWKARLTKSGWCGRTDAFMFLSVDLQHVYTITTLRISGVAGTGYIKGQVTKMQLFHKQQFSQNYDTYPVEFNTPPGNYNRMYIFNLNSPIRARYVLLGITEFEGAPCVRFDLQGCPAPLSPALETPLHLQVGWNQTRPECIDTEPPRFMNCPGSPLYLNIDENGQITAANFSIPTAIDNSGAIAWTRVNPPDFRPPHFINRNLDVTYTAFDSAGNEASCVVRLRLPDRQGPVVTCPQSYAIEIDSPDITELLQYFNETTVDVKIQDVSNISDISFDPPSAIITYNQHVTVTVSAMDQVGNQNSCKFQVILRPAPCKEWSLIPPMHGNKQCQSRTGGVGLDCMIKCDPGFQFVDEQTVNKRFTCSVGIPGWQPAASVPACVPVPSEPAQYLLTVTTTYPVVTPVGAECLQGYKDLAASSFDDLDKTLTQRCSSSVQVFVHFVNAQFFSTGTTVTANYTIQILPTVLQDVFYELCGLTLRTIHDLSIPGASNVVGALMSLSGDKIASQSTGCPTLNASRTTVSRGFGCSLGEVLRQSQQTLPECLACPMGTFFINNTCFNCPEGMYQDEMGQADCKQCPDQTYTRFSGSHSATDCLPVCGNGMYSATGMIPCQMCPKNTFSGPPPLGGYKKECESCPRGSFTQNLGSTGPSLCKLPCSPGEFSMTGLQPCSKCPANFYQPSPGQLRCIECPNTTYTEGPGANSSQQCLQVDCAAVRCQNAGECEVVNHLTRCRCRPGFAGLLCEQKIDSCMSQPCFNGATCVDRDGSYTCVCPQNFSGERCEFGPNDCIGKQCPNGGICQDLPGAGTTKCLCRTGYTGKDCSLVVNVCEGQTNPCKNGAGCQPLELGRHKCLCLPGWSGITCEINIDDCADHPCALNATCKDGINDFTCDCPPGFAGKRCESKQALCAQNPCLNGKCVDRLYSLQCLCEAGWAGEFCEHNIDECASNPCEHGGTCHDEINGYTCQCPQGFFGAHCQHMVDHCSSYPCNNNATCVNEGPTYRCVCKLGFQGTHCEHNVNECETLQRCGPGTQTCLDMVNDFKCLCRAGFTGQFCETEINECASLPCLNNGSCVDGIAGFSCQCEPGWSGDHCEKEIGGCDSNPCQNEGSCVNLVNDYFCVCPSGVHGKNCEKAPKRCIGDPCHNNGVCGDFGSRLECTCPKDYDGVGCQYELDACKADICKNGAECVDYETGYRCTCAPGFTGPNCETNIDNCTPNPCPVTATCIDQVNSYHCQCPFNMTGSNCDKELTLDYDLRFYDPILPASASLSVPFKLQGTELTIALWVRFQNPGSRGTFFTLYSSKEASFPSAVKELLRFSSEGLRLELFADISPLVLTIPSGQSINNGNWHHVSFTWRSNSGEYSLMWNAVRLYAGNNYGNDKKLDMNGWVVLGYPVSATPNEPKFVGSVTRATIWNRALSFEWEIPSLVETCQGARELFNGIVLRWAGYNSLTGKVEMVAPSSCGSVMCPQAVDSHRCDQQVDRSGPQPQFCPSDIYVQTPHRESNITWQAPTFTDDATLEKVLYNLAPGQIFTWGSYLVIYAAYDNSTNIGQCMFWIRVDRQFCPPVPDPGHGVQFCEEWGPGFKFKACQIGCESGYQFSQTVPKFYSCGWDGDWRPLEKGAMSLRYPECSQASLAVRVIKLKLDYPSSVICNNAGRSTITQKLSERINLLNSQWHLCLSSDEEGTCKDLSINVECVTKPDVARNRRQVPGGDHYTATITFPSSRDPVQHAQTSDVAKVMSILESEILLKDGFNFGNVLPSGNPDLSTLELQDVFVCPKGSVAVEDQCVPCAPGSFYVEQTSTCQLCPRGQHQVLPGQMRCSPCTPGYTTSRSGATSLSECTRACEPGTFFNRSSTACEECGYGFYQPEQASFECQPCGLGQTTLHTMSKDAKECRDECKDGFYLPPSGLGVCQACEKGTYRTKGIHKTCQICPEGTTTEKEGGIARTDCNIPRCKKGQFLNMAVRLCQDCEKGYYQDEDMQLFCKPCDVEYTTREKGAISRAACYSTNQCLNEKQNNCSWHATCIDLPDDGNVPMFKCECNPGFLGNGYVCEDACIDYCMNSGECVKKDGAVECKCQQFFTGPHCETRVLPQTQKIAYIGGGIGGAVAILIIIVIIIWMICFRFRQSTKSSIAASDEKPTGTFTVSQNEDQSPTLDTNNFVYSRPPLTYYYEDDDYDMKTMYINDSFEPGPTDKADTGSADKDEMFDRLKRIQQHVFRPRQLEVEDGQEDNTDHMLPPDESEKRTAH